MFASTEIPVLELDLSIKNGVIIRAGETLRLPCHVLGRPQPSIKWTKDDKDPDKQRVEYEDVGRDSTLIIKNVQRSDHGKYQITAANPSGIKSASTRVEVMGE